MLRGTTHRRDSYLHNHCSDRVPQMGDYRERSTRADGPGTRAVDGPFAATLRHPWKVLGQGKDDVLIQAGRLPDGRSYTATSVTKA
jgi:hypothetical protein